MQFNEITTFGIYLHCITNDFEKENQGENFKEYNFKEVEKKWNVSSVIIILLSLFFWGRVGWFMSKVELKF
jgi:hypothetical protein